MSSEDHYRSKTNMASMSTERFESLVKAGAHRQYMSNALQVNTGSGSFSDIANMVGLSSTDWSWASLLVDLDNDGWKDIFISNGIARRPNDLDYIDFISGDKARNNPNLSDAAIVSEMPLGKVKNYFFDTWRNFFLNMNYLRPNLSYVVLNPLYSGDHTLSVSYTHLTLPTNREV